MLTVVVVTLMRLLVLLVLVLLVLVLLVLLAVVLVMMMVLVMLILSAINTTSSIATPTTTITIRAVVGATTILANICDVFKPLPRSLSHPCHEVAAEGEAGGLADQGQEPPGFTRPPLHSENPSTVLGATQHLHISLPNQLLLPCAHPAPHLISSELTAVPGWSQTSLASPSVATT